MIKFIGKFTRNGEIVAWRISEDGVEYNIAYRAIYHEFYFKPMVDAGYKFHDYDCNVTTPDGYDLKDIVESDEYLSDTELLDLLDSIEGGMLEEKDVVQYFDRDINIEFVEMAAPIQENIKTREEFVDYIDTFIKANERNIHNFNPRPINAFANPKALFTLEEVIANIDDARLRFSRMFDNLVMTSLKDLDMLMETYGVSENDTASEKMLKVVKGFFAWGIPGIRANITNIKFDVNPTTSMSDLTSSIDVDAVLKYGIRRKSDYKFYSEDCSGRDFGSLAGDDVCDTHASIGVAGAANSISSIQPEDLSDDYSVVAYGYKRANPRVIITLLSDDGISATFVADCDSARFYRGSTALVSPMKMFRYKTVDNHVFVPFSRIAINGRDYISDAVLIRSYIQEYVKRSVATPKYDTSFKLLTGIGVSPYYAPMLINRYIGDGAILFQDISDAGSFSRLHYYCSDTFRDGFSSKILEKYGTGDDDFSERPISEQLEYMNEEIATLESEGRYLVQPEIPEGMIKLACKEYNDWYDEYTENEIGNANFVMALLNGEQNICQLALGMKIDGKYKFNRAFNVIYGAFMAAREKNPNLECNMFLNTEIEQYIDNSILFKERYATAVGCFKDIANFRSDMAIYSNSIIYVTKVFRENGNADMASATRHYGFECIAFGKAPGTQGSQVYKTIYDQIADQLSANGRTESLIVVGDTAARVVMNILLSKENIIPVNGVCTIPVTVTLADATKFKTSVRLGESYYNTVRNGSLFQKYYSSCYDYCENQFSKANMKCDYYCVNASIGPWNVVPREGATIPEYNLFINYFKWSELAQAYPSSVIDKIKACGGKVFDCLRETFTANELFPSMPSVFSREEEFRMACEGLFLERNEYEDIESYITRTTNSIKEAKKMGLAVKHTLLKSDIQYSGFKPYVFEDGVEQDQTYYDEFSVPITNRHVTNMAPRMLTNTWLKDIDNHLMLSSDSRNVVIERVSFDEIPLDVKMWNRKLCVGDFDESVSVFFSKGRIHYGEGRSKSIANLTEADMDELCNARVAISIGERVYIIKTIGGLVRVGV